MDTENFKTWLVDVAGCDRSEANDLCVSAYESDVKQCERLYARFEQFTREEKLKQLPFDAGFAECISFIVDHGTTIGIAGPMVEWAEDALRLVNAHDPALSRLNRKGVHHDNH